MDAEENAGEENAGEENIGNPEVIDSTEKKGGLVNLIKEYVSGISDEIIDDDNINTEANENSESNPGSESESTKNHRIIDREELESIKDSVVSGARSKVFAETEMSLENETLKAQKNIESFMDNSIPESTDNSLPEIKRRIAPWVPSFLGLAGAVFIVSLLKRGRGTRK
ncbi:hypothetical protein [Methanosarcina horonobensis]|nr:hypothetical protein [Methanosarcina horonobensis]